MFRKAWIQDAKALHAESPGSRPMARIGPGLPPSSLQSVILPANASAIWADVTPRTETAEPATKTSASRPIGNESEPPGPFFIGKRTPDPSEDRLTRKDIPDAARDPGGRRDRDPVLLLPGVEFPGQFAEHMLRVAASRNDQLRPRGDAGSQNAGHDENGAAQPIFNFSS